MKAPKWAVGMRVLAPGIYMDARGDWHLDERAICEHFGVPYTAHNCATIVQAARDFMLTKLGRPIPIELIEDDDAHT
jgi:hypothetical protein